MTRTLVTTTFLLCTLLFFSCQKELGNIDRVDNNLTTSPSPITADLDGIIVDENGAAVANIAVQAGNATQITNERGYFRIINAQLDKRSSLVTVQAPGYYKAYRVFQATPGQNHVKIKLIRKSLAGSVSAGSGGEVTLPNGSQVKLPANGVVRFSDNTPYNGVIRVYANYIDPTATDIAETVPGSFLATDKDGKRVTLASYGMMAVELESDGGERLQIATGNKAIIKIQVPASRTGTAPASLPLWYVDEVDGTWKEQGSATKSGNYYEGEVTHFSFWNADVAITPLLLTIKLQLPDGSPLASTGVTINSSNLGQSSGHTDSEGYVKGYVPANQLLTVRVLGPCGTSAHTQEIGPFASGEPEVIITISDPNLVHTVKGRAISCSGTPVTEGMVVLFSNNNSSFKELNPDGTFDIKILNCASPSDLQIVVANASDNTEGVIDFTPVAGGLTDVGDIEACATSEEFVDYTIGGVTTNITKLQSDSLYSRLMFASQAPDPFHHTKIAAVRMPNQSFVIQILNTATSGHVREIIDNGISYFPVTTVPLNITSHATSAGEFVAGNFSGEFMTQADPQPRLISATYKARRIN